jgi:hypothetical protein
LRGAERFGGRRGGFVGHGLIVPCVTRLATCSGREELLYLKTMKIPHQMIDFHGQC